jgi:hypothetical protein
VYERGNFARLWEMKISWNYKPRMIKTMERVAEYWDRPTETNLIYTGDEEHRVNKSTMINWRNVEWKK